MFLQHSPTTSRPSQPSDGADIAARLDRLADFELQAGHHHQAERLARLAADLRAEDVP